MKKVREVSQNSFGVRWPCHRFVSAGLAGGCSSIAACLGPPAGPANTKRRQGRRTPKGFLAAFLFLAFSAGWLPAQQAPDYSRGPDWFPNVVRPYLSQKITGTPMIDQVDLSSLAVDGTLRLSLAQLRSALLKNNLDIAAAADNGSMADTDILRARGGGAPRGAPGVRIPSGLFAGAIGAGVGDSTTAGGASGAGGITGNARQVVARPRGSYDPSIALNFSVDKNTSPLNTLVVAGLPSVETSTTAIQARFAQAFTTGTSVSVSFNNQRQNSTQRFLRFNPAVVSAFSLTVTQQLMNGYGREVGGRFLEVAERGKRISAEATRQQVMTTLSQAESLYWDLVAARDNVRVAQQALSVAQQLLEDNTAREELGALSKMEVFTAASEAAARRRDLIAAQAVFDSREADLKSLLTRDFAKVFQSVRLDPTDSLPDPVANPPRLEDLLSDAVRNRPELRQAEANLENQEVAVRYTKNLLKPTFVLFGMLNSAGLYGNRLIDMSTGGVIFPGGLTQAFRQVGHFEYPEYAFGFSLQIPLLNRSAQADHYRARIELAQSQTALQQARSRIHLEVRNAITALIQSSAQAQSARKAVELREKSLQDQQEKLMAGLSTPYEVIRLQRDLMLAQFEEVRARTSYAKSRVELDRATGRTGETGKLTN